MPDKPVSDATAHHEEQESQLAQTLEEAVTEELEEARKRINEREAALARAPLQVRRMTRATAMKIGLWF